LTDLISNETIFIQDFFLCEVDALHGRIFGATLQLFQVVIIACYMSIAIKYVSLCFQEHLDKYLSSCYDALTLLIMLCANNQFRVATNRRMVTILNEYDDGVFLFLSLVVEYETKLLLLVQHKRYYDQVYAKLLTRFRFVVDMHVNSIEKATPKNL
jgi:hypothetical protein